MLKKIVDYLPLLTIGLIFLGFWDQYAYYRAFQIPIYNYMESSEIVLAFLSSFLTIALWTVPFSFNIMFEYFLDKISPKQNDETAKDETNEKGKSQKPVIIILTIALMAMLGLVLFDFNNPEAQDRINQSLFFISTAIAVIVYRFMPIREFPLFYVSFFTLYFLGFYLIRSHAGEIIKKYGNKQLVSFSIKESHFHSNDSITYIGETKDYLFIFDRTREVSLVIKKEEIDSLQYHAKVNVK